MRQDDVLEALRESPVPLTAREIGERVDPGAKVGSTRARVCLNSMSRYGLVRIHHTEYLPTPNGTLVEARFWEAVQ